MKKLLLTITLLLPLLLLNSCALRNCSDCPFSSSSKKSTLPKGIIELAGTLHRPVKGLPQIYLGEYGKIRRIDLKGKALENIENGANIKIIGSMQSKFFDGGTDADHLAMPSQWKLWIDVAKVEVIPDDDF
jgi:hypothetical protein